MSKILQLLERIMLAALMLLAAHTLSAQPLPVVASFSILADMVREVGGSYIHVSSLVGSNADSHVFDPTPADAKRIASARLVFVNGLGYEGWLDRLVKSSGYRGQIIVASDGITILRKSNDHHAHAHADARQNVSHAREVIDPHAWQNLANAQHYVENIRKALVQALPTNAEYFDRRAADYIERIRALELATKLRIADVPQPRRRVITSHDAFGYFAEAYGLTFYPLQGLGTASEPSATEIIRIVDQIKKNKVTAIFTENISDPRVLERIAKDSGAKVGGRLYADALTEPGTAADTYLKMFELNVSTIVAGIAGTH